MSRSFFVIALSFMLMALARTDDDLQLWAKEFDPTTQLFSSEAVTRNTDQSAYRLPTNVSPLEFDVYIDLYFAERTDRPYSYDGRVFVTIQANEEGVQEIVLHSNVDAINDVSVVSANNVLVPLNSQEPFSLEPQYHLLKIHLLEPLQVASNYTLYINYTSTMNEGPMKRGIWRGWYIDENNVTRVYATTHFQPYNARQAFPCWDEPYFKSVFQLHLSRPSSYNATFSNTKLDNSNWVEDQRIQDNFLPTPRTSVYLVTFLVSETFTVIAEDETFDPPIRIIGRSNTVGLGDHALKLAVGMTQQFDTYFQIPYASMHPNLLNDHISSPDWASAATENWGMVSYRELYLIIHRNETIMNIEHYAATLVSHELAHKWMGNLITCYWWSNTWINEGFASYFGYMATHAVFPEYELNEHFNSRYLQTSLSYDSGTGTVPLNHDVNTPAQVTGHFGTISYSKGAAFLRMTMNIISEPTFRRACTVFLEMNKFEPVTPYDLYEAFKVAIDEHHALVNYPGFDFYQYYQIWVNEPGYPILEVTVNDQTIEMRQERFFLSQSATATDQVYPIPISYATQDNNIFTNTRPALIMSTKTETIPRPGSGWIIFNNLQHGHYRVNYDHNNWQLIAQALLENPSSIHHLNRAQIVNDVFALMRSGRMTYSYGFNILKFLRHETNFHVWDPAIDGYTWLRNRLRHLPDRQAEFDAHIRSYLDHAIETYGFEIDENETATETLARHFILHFACMIGHEKCIQESYDMFLSMMNNEWVDPRLRRSVYVTGMREGDVSHFEFLLKRYRESNFANDQLEILRGMAAARDPSILTRYLDFTMTYEVRSQDKVNSFNYALLGNKENANTVLQYVMNNIDTLRTAFIEDSPANPVGTALANLASYLDEAGLNEYETWMNTYQSSSAQYASTLSAIASARNNIAWGTENADTILNAARDSATAVVTSITVLALATIIALIM